MHGRLYRGGGGFGGGELGNMVWTPTTLSTSLSLMGSRCSCAPHRFFDRNVKNLVKKLLTADLTKRYGCLKNGAEDIKKHKWLSSIDYNALYSRTLTAPITPRYGCGQCCILSSPLLFPHPTPPHPTPRL